MTPEEKLLTLLRESNCRLIAKETGVGYSTLSNIKNGYNLPSQSTLRHLLHYFEKDAEKKWEICAEYRKSLGL